MDQAELNDSNLESKTQMSSYPDSRYCSDGFTLIELMIVVAILAIITLVTFPNLSSVDPIKVDHAATQVAAALRFTRSESIRTGIPHGMVVDHDNADSNGKDITVYQLDLSGSPFTIDHIVTHPISKQLYDTFIPDSQQKLNIGLQNNAPAFTYGTVGASRHIHFNHLGRPVYYQNGQPHRLLNTNIIVGNNTLQRKVLINSLNGRVALQ